MVNTVTFPNGLVISDGDDPTTGLANGGHRDRFVPSLAAAVDTYDRTVEAHDAALLALGSSTTVMTSATTASIPSIGGTISINVGASKNITAGQLLSVVDGAAIATKGVYGRIQSYDAGTGALVVYALDIFGSGSASTWKVGLSPYGVSAARSISAGGLATGGGDLSADRTITVPAAAAADVAAGTDATKAMTSKAFWDAQLAVAVAYAGSLILPCGSGFNFVTTFTGAPTIGQPTGMKAGQSIMWEMIAGSGAGQPVFNSTYWKRPNGTPTFDLTLGHKNYIVGRVVPDGTHIVWDLKKYPI